MSDEAVVVHNRRVLQELEIGDTIEFPRGFYSHWAVYIGDGQVVHLTGEDNDGIDANFNSGHLFTICGQKFKKAFVKVDNFGDVVLGSNAKVNKNKDRKMQPLSKEEIRERALSRLGEIGYNVLWQNCEHFASWCRYGTEKSDQVDKALTWAAVGTSALVLLGIATGSAWRSGRSQEMEKEESVDEDDSSDIAGIAAGSALSSSRSQEMEEEESVDEDGKE